MKMNFSFEGDIFEDKESFHILIKAFDYYYAFHEFDEFLRKKIKHGCETEIELEIMEKMREELHEILNQHGVTL
jgi:hypothetical protein